MLAVGTVLDNKYEIIKQIGKGGTSLVYLAMNQKLNQQWVIKEIRSELDAAAKNRMLQEARLMMTFDHPAIPRIVDILDNTYIVMDYVSGQSLAHELKEHGPVSQETAVEWVKQICNVLVYLHSQDPPIIYHDLKPGNIILKMPERNLKLIDFGEARKCVNGNAPGGGKTREYAAPEQQTETRGNTDPRTDIYCFGTTMYRLLTGQFVPPYPEPVGSIRERFPQLQISKGMDNIIRKCTRKDPDRRFQSAEELMQALDNIVLWDEDYLAKQKRKIHLCVGSLAAAAVMLVAGIGFNRGAAFQDSQTYESLIGTEAALGYESQVNNYLEAVALNGQDTRAYTKLVEAYQSNGVFGDEQSQQLGNAYNANKAGFTMSDPDMVELNYQIGHLYFNMYTGDGNAFRSRIQKAQGYFTYVVEYGSATDEHYQIASSYKTLCDFFTSFVLNDSSVLEPTEEDYRAMMAAIETCMEDMQGYTSSDAAYTRLTLYQKIMDAVNTNIRGFAQNGIEQTEVRQLVQNTLNHVRNESVTQPTSVALQISIVDQGEDVLDNITREYDSMKRGN